MSTTRQYKYYDLVLGAFVCVLLIREVPLRTTIELAEERQGEILTRTQELVTGHGGEWESHEPWGRRRLAYEIDHKPEGVYHLLSFRSTPETLDEVSRVLKITDGVIRYGAYRRVKGSTQTKAPAPLPAWSPACSPSPPSGTTPSSSRLAGRASSSTRCSKWWPSSASRR